MGDDEGPTKRNSLLTELRKAARQVPIETDGLGTVHARELSMAMADALCDRLKDDATGDLAVAHIFMGCATGKLVDASDLVADPLSEAEAAQLSDDDVRRFAPMYLTEVVGEKEPAADSIARIAEHARGELKQAQERRKRFAEAVAASMRPVAAIYKDVFSNAKEMQNWTKIGAQYRAMADALKPISLESIGETVRAAQTLRDAEGRHPPQPADVFAGYNPPDLRAFDPPPVEETPHGRTMLAAESASAAVARIEDAIGMIVTQAGRVSELIATVIKEIEDQGRKLQERTEQQTARTLRYARWSLAVSALALVASAAFNAQTYFQGKSATDETAHNTRELVTQAQRQSDSLAKLVESTSKPTVRKPPKANSSAGVQNQKTPSTQTPVGNSKVRD